MNPPWVEVLTGMTDEQTSLTVEHGDIFKLTGVCDGIGDEQVGYIDDNDFNNSGEYYNINTDIYTKFLIRWKTSVGSNGLGAKVILDFSTDHSDVQVILGTATVPVFSTSWRVTSGTITPGKTVKRIIIYADDYPDSVASGEYYVYYDFLLLHKNTFTFPYVHVVGPELRNVYADLHPPGRVGTITQYMGMESPVIRLSGKIDTNVDEDSGWGVPLLDKLYYIFHEAHTDPWQWFSTGGLADAEHPERFINCKVTPRNFKFDLDKDSESYRAWSVELRKYDKSSGAELTWADKQYFGI